MYKGEMSSYRNECLKPMLIKGKILQHSSDFWNKCKYTLGSTVTASKAKSCIPVKLWKLLAFEIVTAFPNVHCTKHRKGDVLPR